MKSLWLGGATKEEALGAVLTGMLREVDPLQDPQHIFHLPSTQDDAIQSE